MFEAVRALDISTGNENTPTWDSLDSEERATLYKRVEKTLSDPRAGDATFHNEWVAQMKGLGWSSGRHYSEEARQHPNLLPFHLLDPELQNRERLMRAVCLSLSRV